MSELKFKELGDKRKIIVCKLFGIYIISKFCLLFIVAFDCGLTHGCNMNEYDIYYIFNRCRIRLKSLNAFNIVKTYNNRVTNIACKAKNLNKCF